MSRFIVGATWDDAPHLSDTAKKSLLASIPPYQRDARAKGIPQLGAGAIYQVPESEIKVAPFPIPDHYRRGYGLDVGWNRTAGAFLAEDPDTRVTYIYSTHYRAASEPTTHAAAIKARGEWLPGKIDPASHGRSQIDGQALFDQYTALGLKLTNATNAVETGIYAVWMALGEGRLKVFSTCADWFAEYRLYRRDERGRIIKKFDHLMDATRYGFVDGTGWMLQTPRPPKLETTRTYDEGAAGLDWMA